MFNLLALAWLELARLVLDSLGFLLASLDFASLYLLCLICLALLALLVFTSLTCFAWLSYARLDLVAKLARSLVLDFEQLLSFFLQNDGSFYC